MSVPDSQASGTVEASNVGNNQDNGGSHSSNHQVADVGNLTSARQEDDRLIRRRLAAFQIPPHRIKEYHGKSLKECREFLAGCEDTFLIDPGVFLEDHWKILYTKQYLKGVPSDSTINFLK